MTPVTCRRHRREGQLRFRQAQFFHGPRPRKGRTFRPAFASLVLLMPACTHTGDSPHDLPALDQEAPFHLVRVGGYGDESAPESARFGAGMLANIREAIQSPSGEVFVLDPNLRKVAIFDESGTFQRLGPAGAGEGPGEFQLPIAMDLAAFGGLYIYDFDLARLTLFDRDNEVERIIRLPLSTFRDLIVHAERVFATRIATTTYYVEPFDLDGEPLDRAVPLSSSDSLFSPDGSTGAFGRRLDGRPMLAAMRPGVWFELNDENEWVESGRDLLGAPAAVEYDGRLRNLAQVYGIIELRGVGILIAFAVFDFSTEPLSLDGYIAVFDNGEFLGVVKLPYGWIGTFSPTADGLGVFMSETDPFPRVVRYDVRPSE